MLNNEILPIKRPAVLAGLFIKFLFFSLLILSAELFALSTNNPVDKIAHNILLCGLEELHAGEYEESIITLSAIERILPEHPAGYFFHASVLQWTMSDMRDFSREAEFNILIDKAVSTADKMVKKNSRDPWGYFYRGGATGFKGLNYISKGDWWNGFTWGNKGQKDMKKVLEMTSAIPDAGYGLGLYHYWKSVKSKNFFWMPFVEDERAIGLKYLSNAVSKGTYTRTEAEMSIMFVYWIDWKITACTNALAEILTKYPDYLYARWYAGKIYMSMNEWKKAEEQYLWLLDYFSRRKNFSPLAQAEIFFYLGQSIHMQGRNRDAKKYLTKNIRGKPAPGYETESFDQFKEMRDELINSINGKWK